MGLPTGPTVTFLFTDIEGSTRLERALGSAAWPAVVARHDRLLRDAIEGAGGVVVKTEGDAFFAAFGSPVAAASAAVAAQRAIASEPWPAGAALRIRMGLHLGEGRLREGRAPGEAEDYVGIDVNYAARIAAVGNGGQVVVSDALVGSLPDGLAAIPGADGLELVDEGLRTVKDFEEPTRLHRLVVPGAADDTRPLRTIDVPTNLPGDVTTLVGRDAEIAALRAALTESRIVTLTGPGGSGKTRLALGVARSITERFAHGVWFVDLAALREPNLLESAIAATLGIGESPERSVTETLRAHLRDRSVLLVLDNLEQLMPAGADIVSALARSAPQLRILVTSRELLRIAGERGYAVPPLDLDAGIALFMDRARTHRPDLVMGADAVAAVRAICERLGGLPLAIELAAARLRTLSPSQINERLGHSLDLAGGARDVPERQRTLRGAIAWSHDLLPEPERRLFRRLAVFVGGWTLETATPVADRGGDLGVDLPDGLESLADKSLIRVEPADSSTGGEDEVRFGMHPLLREYALERLDESGERADTEARHAAVMTELAERIGAAILTAAGEVSMRHLDHEEHNLRAAIEWALAGQDPDVGLRLMGSTWRWYQQRGRLREGRALLTDLLARAPGDPRIRIGGLAAEGGLAYWMDDIPGARTAYEERLALAESLHDPVLIADGHYDLGFVFMVLKDADALRLHEGLALDGYIAAGREGEAIRARQAFVLALFLAGDYPAALEQQEAAIARLRLRDSHTEIADSQTLLAAILFQLGRPRDAWREMSEALRFFAAGSLASGTARAMVMAAILDIVHGDPERGTRIAGVTYELSRAQNIMLGPVTVLHLPDPRSLAVERLGAERADALLASGGAAALEDAIAEVLAVDPANMSTAVTTNLDAPV